MTVLWEADPLAADNLRMALGDGMQVVESGPAAVRLLVEDRQECLLVVGPDIDLNAALNVTEELRLSRSDVGVVLMRRRLGRRGARAGAAVGDARGRERRRPERSGRCLPGAWSCPATRQRLGLGGFAGGPGGDGVLGQGRRRQDDLRHQPRRLPGLRRSSKVLLVDLDLAFGDVAIACSCCPAESIIDLVTMAGPPRRAGHRVGGDPARAGLSRHRAPAEPGDADRIPASVVRELIRVAAALYDFVMLDTPPAFTEHVLAAFDASDVLDPLATLDIPAMKNLRLTLDTLDLLGNPQGAGSSCSTGPTPRSGCAPRTWSPP